MDSKRAWTAIMRSFGYNSLQEVFEAPPRSTVDTLYRDIAVTAFLDGTSDQQLAALLEKYVWAHIPNGPQQTLVSEAIERLGRPGRV